MMTESLSHASPEDIFAKAIERVEAGEAVETVVAAAPEPLRAELREVLLLVNATHHLHRAPVPQPSAPRRAERKRAFLEAAAEMKAATALPPTPVAVPAPKMQSARIRVSWLSAVADFWHDLQASFTAPNLRLAPLLTLIVVVYLGAFGFVRAASASGIGDRTYVVKQWMRDQKFNLSSPAQRPYVYIEIIDELVADINATSADREAPLAPAPVTQRLVFDGFAGDYLISGKLRILLRYQPDLSVEQYTETTIPTTPGVGQFVEVTFQVAPSKDANNPSAILQAISIIVPNSQPVMDPTPTPTATATVSSPATPCQPYLPDGWIRYSVAAGDTLTAIAARTGATVAQLQAANCLDDANRITANAIINAPKMAPTNTPTAGVPTLAATLTAISTTVLTPSVGITPTATLVPTGTAPVTVTPPAITATVAPTVTSVITDPASQTPTAVATPTPPMTATATVTSEPTTDGTPTATTVATTGTPPAPTVTTTALPDLTTTATATTESVPSPTEAATEPNPTAAATPTPEPLPTATTASNGGRDGNPTETPPPTSDANQGGSGGGSSGGSGVQPTPTSTPVPQSRSPLTGG
jgi:murein DD-endopeptidase MepM/ murein hydrolase activator NlpD